MLVGASLISEIPSADIQVYEVSLNDNESLYANIIYHLKNGYAPSHLDHTKKRALRLKAKQYQLLNDVLFRINYDSVLLRCLEESEAKFFLQELHDGPAGGHYVGDTTAHKILRAGYYWPTLFKDSHNYVRKCQVCQTSAGRQKKPSLPLQSVNIERPFDQWGLDIIGEIVPHSSKQHRYILTTTYYFTKWVEAVPLKTANAEHIIEFIDQFIITRFGLPSPLMFDNESYFSGNAMTEFALKRDRITQKASIGTSPFNLVYGKEVVLPIHLEIPSLSLVQYIDEVPTSSLQLRQMEIIKLEEQREQAKRTHAHHQALVKSSFDSNIITRKDFQVGDLVLKWDKAHEEKGKHTKFQQMWLGPFQIVEIIGLSTSMLQDLTRKRDSLPVNGQILNKYFP
eukprot:PITA_19223